MRMRWLAIWILIATLGVPTLAVAQSPTPTATSVERQQVAALLAQFPNGGPALRAAIARAVEMNPDLAVAFVIAALKANRDQKQAIGAGLADAANYFAKVPLDWARLAEAKIRNAMLLADGITQFAFVQAETPTLAQGIPGFGNAGVTTTTCPSSKPVISPSGPGSPSNFNC
jgi:hypothetical protein